MSGTSRQCCLGLLSLLLILMGVSALRADDFLEQVRRRNQIAAQKLEQEVVSTLTEARKLERTDPIQAERLLRRCRAELENDTFLTDQRRNELLRQVNLHLRDAQVQARQKQEAELPPGRTGTGLRPIDNGGKTVTKTATDLINSGKAGLEQMARIKAQRERGVVAALREDPFTIPENGVSQLPKYWKELLARRKKYSGPELTDREKELLKALNSVLSVDFKQTAFRDVINYLSEKTGQTILMDNNSLKDANVEYDDPVDLSVKKVSFRTILKKILGDKGLTYIIREGMIEVMTPQKARDTMIVRAYPVGDLLPVVDPRFGPFVAQAQQVQSVAAIIQMIQTTVEPGSWQLNGGPGTIIYNPTNQTLVIRNSAEMHFMMPQVFAGGGR